MRSRSLNAAFRGLSNTTPAPSLRTYPLARASKAKHCPSGETIEALLKPTVACGVIKAFTPPTSAASQAPEAMFWQAIQTPTAEDEHAVSTETLGPVKSKT